MKLRDEPAPALLAACSFGGFRASLTRYPAGLVQARHSHAGAGASILLAGAVQEEWRSGAFTARPFAGVHKPSGAAHETRFGPRGAIILSVGAGPGAGAGAPCWSERPAMESGVIDALLAALAGGGSGAEAEDAAAAFLAALGPPGEESGAAPAWLGEMFDRLAEEPATAPSLAALAQASGIDPSYASRAFRTRFGIGPLRHRRRARCYRALDLLLGGAAPAEAAAAAGFADQSHLTREFRARFGTTPGRISRRQVKNVQDRAVLAL